MSLKCLVFDCDGVILDSVPVKTRAFGRLAEPYGPEARDRFVLYHTVHGGVSRYRKFEWFFREVLGREITPEESADWARKFAEYALDEVRKCDLIPGALQTLETWHGKMPLYVCSGAPVEELNLVLGERGLARFFAGIYGSPPAKGELLVEIIRSRPDLAPAETLMVGDSITDEDAAKQAEAQFYGIGRELKGGNFPWSENLLPLNAWIAAHV
ncbi:MAG: HAD family hydrolase [Desulfovibrio sp.]|nr:HAD family hydrolase [Desulfovibrio sp.]